MRFEVDTLFELGRSNLKIFEMFNLMPPLWEYLYYSPRANSGPNAIRLYNKTSKVTIEF